MIAQPALVKLFKCRTVFFIKTDDQGAGIVKIKIQNISHFMNHFIAAHIQSGFQGTGHGIVPGMDNTGIGFGCSLGNVFFFFQQGHL